MIFLCQARSWGQQEFVQGRLLDANSNEPVIFATIRVKGKALGVISNQDGGFRFPVKFKEKGDSLVISSMGYESKNILMTMLLKGEVNIVKLNPGVIELSEVLLEGERKRRKKLSAKKIVRNAIEAIPDNYPTKPFSLIGYYRDYQYANDTYINLNEAILEVYDPGFHELDNLNTKVRLYYKIRNMDFERDTVADNKYGNHIASKKIINKAYLFDYGGNEFIILRVHDAIRNYKMDTYDFVNRLETDLFKNHFFRRETDTYTEEEILYTIRLTKSLPEHFVEGHFYISKKDFSIHKMQYAVYEKSEANVKKLSNEYKSQLFEVITEYKKRDGKMYPNYISFHNDFQLIEPPDFEVDEVVFLRDSQCFEVRFNKEIDLNSAKNIESYNFSFKRRKIRFKNIVVYNNAVRLFPDLSPKAFQNIANVVSVYTEKPKMLQRILEIEIKGVLDSELRSRINENRERHFQQFREFFVQKLNIGTIAPKAIPSYMNKNRPIFDDQPVSEPDGFDIYWMNTPLKSIEN